MKTHEQIITGLKCIAHYPSFCGTCVYSDDGGFGRGCACHREVAQDALKMLTDNKKPIVVEKLKSGEYICRCPNCAKAVFYAGQKYCDLCGQKLSYPDEE